MTSLSTDYQRLEDDIRRALAEPQEAPPRRIVSRSQLPMYGISCSDVTLYKMIREAEFPPPIKIGGQNYWFLSALDAWLAARPSWVGWIEKKEDGRRGRKVRNRKAA